jgi:Raf kinase inhibitor-like YbhB/YbcL family protein
MVAIRESRTYIDGQSLISRSSSDPHGALERAEPFSIGRGKGIFLCIALLLAACATTTSPSFTLQSSAFAPNATMPESTILNGLDCHGPNTSPALTWSGAPAATKSFALICDDYEARGGDGFIHWVLYNIPATATGLPENAGASEGDLANSLGRHAYNDFLRRRYDGPCPPEGPPHKYRFTVYALDLPSIDDAGTPMTWRKLRFIIKGHVLAKAELTGLRGHP